MESIRRSEKIRISAEIRTYENYISNSENNLSRLRKMKSTEGYVKKQIEKESASIESFTKLIAELNERLSMVENGDLDQELNKQIKQNTKIAKEKALIKKEEVIKKRKEKEEDEKISKDYYNKEKGGDRKNNYYGPQKFFFRTCENIPEYMLTKLSKLPCNKGHIWKGIHCYGERPNDNSGELTMYERTYEGENLTHVWTTDTYSVYKKDDKRRNILIKEEPRKKIR